MEQVEQVEQVEPGEQAKAFEPNKQVVNEHVIDIIHFLEKIDPVQ